MRGIAVILSFRMPILGRKTCRVEAAEEEMSREKCRRPLPSSAGFTLLRKPYENMYIYWKCENAENRSDIDPISTFLKAKVEIETATTKHLQHIWHTPTQWEISRLGCTVFVNLPMPVVNRSRPG